jgi:phosphatidylserine/phosphatidylglycerophosphate/cardiolipin synthase-like enzyme
MERRILASGGQSGVPREFLQSMLVAELVRPGRRLWLVSPWISDIEVIDNSGRRFGTIDPTWEAGMVRLTQFISTYLERSGSIAVVMNHDDHNNWMLRLLEPLVEEYDGRLIIRQQDEIHAKGIVGDHFALTGSMNITFSGVHINDEYLTYTSDASKVMETVEQFEHYLGGLAK